MYTQMDQATNISASDCTIETNSVPRRQGNINRKFRNVYSTYTPNHRFSRYNNALLGLWPIRLKENTSELLVSSSGFFSFMTSHWVLTYLKDSSNNKNEIPIQTCAKMDSCKINSIRLDGLFNEQVIKKGQNNLSVLRVVMNFVRTRMIFACILYILAALISMLGLVLFLPNILKFDNIYTSLQFVIMLISTEFLSCFLYSACNALNLRTAIRLRAACFASLYRHALHTTLTYKFSSWQLVSFLLSEGQHVHNLVMAIPDLICTPIILICSLLFAGSYLHLWGYLSVLITIGIFPIFIIIALLSNKLLLKATFFSDQRVKILEEFIFNNLYVKFFKLEKIFKSNIANVRSNEVNYIKRAGLYDNLCFSFILLQPFLSLVALYIGSFYYDNNTSISTFAAISIILLIHVKKSLDNFWYGLNNFCKGIVALKKYKKLKVLETISLNHKKPEDKNLAICIENANFQWTKQKTLNVNNSNAKILYEIRETLLKFPKTPPTEDILHDININIEHGKLIGICGMSGSGRSSLLLAIMGLLIRSKGKRFTTGHFAYINQEPLIFNDSLKNNILFGNKLDSQRYYRVSKLCGLQDFFLQLPEQDDTIISSKLIALEQKQRIILARALYENADIYLLDQPLSALSYNQSMRVFEECLKNSLQDKTVLLVTNQIKFLEQCDEVYLIDKGTIILKGHHNDLLMQQNQDYIEFIKYLEMQRTICKDKSNLFEIATEIPISQSRMFHENETDSNFMGSKDSLFDCDTTDNIIKMNDSQGVEHALKNVLSTYFSYLGNCFALTFLFCAQIINASLISCLPVYFIFSLVYFSKYIINFSIYLGLFLWMLIFGIIINNYFNKKMFAASKLFHNDILKKLYRTTFAFFQTNSFRIISTISVQLQLTDYEIPHLIQNIFLNIFVAIITSCIVLFTSPWYIIFIIFITVLLMFITRFVRKTLLSYNRFDMKYTDVLYTEVLNMLTARPIIQAYDKMNFVTKRLYDTYDEYMTNLYIIYAAKSWYNLITHCCTVLLIACVAFAIVLLTPVCALGQLSLFNIDANTSESLKMKETIACNALAIVCILQVSYVLQKAFVLYLNLGLSFDALSQVETFKMSIDDEAPLDDDDDDEDDDDDAIYNKDENKQVIVGQSLSIKFLNVCLYLEVPLLNEFSFNIRENEKAGFLGLTSSERKGIIAILYKLSNISSGTVMIGKRRISYVPLKYLRSLISVIPAEPFLFNASIKKILSENGQSYFSETISEISVLQKFMLFERVNTLPYKIDSNADEFLNTEEKQILCLAQAYIKQSPIVIVEDFLNGSILEFILGSKLKELFPQSIVLIFANDITGLRKCDTVFVVKEGKVVNADSFSNTVLNLSIVPETSL